MLGARCFCIPMNILELWSKTVDLEIAGSFWVFLLRSVRWCLSSMWSRANYFKLLRQETSEYPMSCESQGFQSGEWEQALFPNQCECHTVSSSFLRLFFTQPWVIFLTFVCWLLLCGRLTGDPLKISRFLFETLSNLLLCSINSSFLVSPDCQLCLLNWRSPPGSVWLPLSWAEAYELS